MEVKLDQFNKNKKESKSTPKTSLRQGWPKKREESSSSESNKESVDDDNVNSDNDHDNGHANNDNVRSKTESEKNSVEEESDNDATREDAGEEDEEEEDNEPLALLVVHAAMHMLFLPQFTCKLYEGESDIPDYLSDNNSLLSNFDGNNNNNLWNSIDRKSVVFHR